MMTKLLFLCELNLFVSAQFHTVLAVALALKYNRILKIILIIPIRIKLKSLAAKEKGKVGRFGKALL